jgi:hypothetical protein
VIACTYLLKKKCSKKDRKVYIRYQEMEHVQRTTKLENFKPKTIKIDGDLDSKNGHKATPQKVQNCNNVIETM